MGYGNTTDLFQKDKAIRESNGDLKNITHLNCFESTTGAGK